MPCDVCRGSGWEIVEKDGREFARPCSCRGSQRAQASFVDTCRVPPRYEHCTLATFEPFTPSHTAALEKAMRYCAGYPFLGIDEGLGLLLSGSNGVGKTHLAVAVLHELFTQKGVRGQFWDFHELIRAIKSSYDPDTKTPEIQVLSPVIEADVLLLDDLGAWRITDWMNDTLFQILNSRYLAKRATIITTNFQDVSPEEALKATASARKEFFVDRIGQRLRSRIVEMCMVVRLEGHDHREAKQHSHRVAVMGTSTPDPSDRRR